MAVGAESVGSDLYLWAKDCSNSSRVEFAYSIFLVHEFGQVQ